MTDHTTTRTVKEAVGDGQADGHATARVGCASLQDIVEKTAVSPSDEPSADDYYTDLLHNPEHDPGLIVSERSGNRRGGYYTNPLHNVRTHFAWQGNRLHYRRRVPRSLVAIVGKKEIWRSLGTDSPTVALRRSHQVAAAVELDFPFAMSDRWRLLDAHLLM